jgi:hypothetical protein
VFCRGHKICFYTNVFGYYEKQKIVLLNTVSKKHTAFLQFCFPSMTFLSTLQFLICCGTGFEVFTVAVNHYAFCVRTTYDLVHNYECSGGPFWSCLSSPLEDTGIMSSPKPQYPQISLHCPVILNTKHLNLKILLFPCIVSPFIINQRYACIRQKSVRYCTFPSEQKSEQCYVH